MKSCNKTAVLYLYCDEHARSQQNFHDFANAELISNIDYFFAGSKNALSAIQCEGNRFAKMPSRDGENEHRKISRFYHDYVQKSDYQNIIVVSSVMSGPYSIPNCTQNWIQTYTRHLTKGVHLVGSTIVVMPADHPLTKLQNATKAEVNIAPYVPTSSFAISREALDFLDTKCFFDQDIPACELSLQLLSEMRMSDLLLDIGWNIACLLPKYSNIDFRSAKRIQIRAHGLATPAGKTAILVKISINKNVFLLKRQILNLAPHSQILNTLKMLNCLEFFMTRNLGPQLQVISFPWTILRGHNIYMSHTQC